ncbi:hypothetical protein EKG37_00585 [Robertmurraya yapensis]|uniref:Uncharacterized protein n=1 Tax=Bacillus yapensis TaxID=2492960 RepID=A0A431WKE6_9BACI|nr:hypothetical protein [Bacillus yapensis]RTR36088.1 hypothetical protein EKG37_00585 [Bacillus yapensis]TKT05591.1 hypothetical protein FAR12_00585 [Bacillus yapensis]
MDGYSPYSELVKKYNVKHYGVTSTRLNSLIESGEINVKQIKDRTFISVQSFEKYLMKVDRIRSEYMVLEEAFVRITGKSVRSDSKGLHRFIEQVGMETLILEIPITRNEKFFIKKSSCDKFLEDYISLFDAYKELNIDVDIKSFRDSLLKQGIDIVSLQNLYEYKFVRKEEVYKKYRDVISVRESVEQLSISPENFRATLKMYNIETFFVSGPDLYLGKSDFNFIKNLQEESLKELNENTYTYEEVELLHNTIGTSKADDNALKRYEIKGVVSPFVRTEKYKYKKVVYDKKGIDDYIARLRTERTISALCNTITDYPILLNEILEFEDVQFSENAQVTKGLWFQYTKNRLRNMSGNRETSIGRVIAFKYTTKLICEFTRERELLSFSENEINLGIFNNNVPKKYQGHVYSFLCEVVNHIEQKTGKRIMNLSNLKFKRESKKKISNQDEETYDLEEYISLYNYVKDYRLHKKLALDNIKYLKSTKDLKNIKEYKKYDSMWLYVLLHINNGWRKGTVVEFPRYPSHLFDKFNLNSFEDLEKLSLTNEEAEQVIRFYQIRWFEHNKNKEKATFYCSSELKLSMAYAILICEFRCRHFHIHEESHLIHFFNRKNEVTQPIHSSFFGGYKEGFKFESRKMNRTVLSITSSVIESTLNGDPMLIAQHLRGHTNLETTNIYIKLPQEHLDFITEQLFDTGYFGFIYHKVNNLLLGDNLTNRLEKTQKSIELRKLLGDVVKLEDMASYLNSLSNRDVTVGTFLEELPKEELKNRLNLINLGLSPAREETYQCFFSTCIAPKADCNKCPFSIPHFYSLSTITKRLKRTLTIYKSIAYNSQTPIGEKNKLYNLLILDYSKIIEAKQMFGAEIIEMLLDDDLNVFIGDLEELPDPQEEGLQPVD